MKENKKKLLILVLIVVFVLSALMLLAKRKMSIKNAPTPGLMTYTVEVVLPVDRQIKQTRSFLAKLNAKDISKLSSKFTGRIKKVLVTENQNVEKDDLLVLIDDSEITSTIKSLNYTRKAQEKDIEYVQNLHSRNQILFKAGGLAKEKLDASEVEYFHKKAALATTIQKIASTKVQLTYLRITAPFDGIVGTIYLQEGSLAGPSQPIITINSYTQKLIFSYVPNETGIVVGKNVIFQNKTIGKISGLYSDAERGLRVAEVSVDSFLLQANGSYLDIEVVTFEGSGCTLPVNALLHKNNKTEIMLYKNEQFRPVNITVIARNKEFALISPCPYSPVAIGAEAKLSQLPVYKNIRIKQGAENE